MSSVTHLVVTDNFAGVERYVCTVARAAAEHGWTVRVLGGRADDMRRELPDEVSWIPAPTVRAAVAALRRSPRSDVLHVHMSAAEVAAAVVRRGRVVVSTRHFAARRGSSSLARAVTGLAARRLDAELAVSDAVRRAAGDPDMPVLLPGVPASEVARVPRRTVVVAQRFEKEKRTLDAVRAFAASGLAHDGWTLELHGEGSEQAIILAEVGALGIASSTRLPGWSRDVSALLAGAGIVLVPGDRDSFGLFVAEAMAAGAPVIAAAAGGHLETLGAAPGARLYPPGDIEACADELRLLARQDSSAREGYGARLRDWQRQHLDSSGHVDRLLHHYRELLGRKE